MSTLLKHISPIEWFIRRYVTKATPVGWNREIASIIFTTGKGIQL